MLAFRASKRPWPTIFDWPTSTKTCSGAAKAGRVFGVGTPPVAPPAPLSSDRTGNSSSWAVDGSIVQREVKPLRPVEVTTVHLRGADARGAAAVGRLPVDGSLRCRSVGGRSVRHGYMGLMIFFFKMAKRLMAAIYVNKPTPMIQF